MTALKSNINTGSKGFRANARAMRALVGDLRARTKEIAKGGGAAARRRHRAAARCCPASVSSTSWIPAALSSS